VIRHTEGNRLSLGEPNGTRSERCKVIADSLIKGMRCPISALTRATLARMAGDLEVGRPMELEAVVGAVVELGERFGIPMPYTRTVYACTRLLGDKR